IAAPAGGTGGTGSRAAATAVRAAAPITTIAAITTAAAILSGSNSQIIRTAAVTPTNSAVVMAAANIVAPTPVTLYPTPAATSAATAPSNTFGASTGPGTNSIPAAAISSTPCNDSSTEASDAPYRRTAITAETIAAAPTPAGRKPITQPASSALAATSRPVPARTATSAPIRPIHAAEIGDQCRKLVVVSSETASMTSSNSAGDSLAATGRSTSSSPS